MAAAALLTPGTVAAIAQADVIGTLQPVLQVVDLQAVNPAASIFRMVLSDGVYSLQSVLTPAETPRARDGSIRKGSIIRLTEFCSTVQSRRVIAVIKLDVLQSEHDIIGNSKPFEKRNAPKEQYPGTASVDQGMLAEITNVLGYLAKPVLFTVKATLSVKNPEDVCYVACPMVVNGKQCNGAVCSNGYEVDCDGCNMTFVDCDYRYRIFVQLEDLDSMSEIFATTSQEAGEEIFGQTARELYVMKYEKQDHAQYNNIVMGVQNCEYLVDIKLNREVFSDGTLPMFTIVKVESVNPSAGNQPVARRPSVGMRTGFSDLDAHRR